MNRADQRPVGRVKVWDLAVRGSHFALLVLVALAFLTSDEGRWTPIHVRVGLVVLGLLIFRVIWGFIGTSPARFSSFVRSPREVLRYLRSFLSGRPPVHLSHNPLGAVMVMAMLGLLGAITLTGILIQLGPEWDGPLAAVLDKRTAHAIKEVHEVAAEALPWLIAVHVIGVLVSSRLERQSLVAGMITGYKRAEAPLELPAPSLAQRFIAFGAAVLAGGGIALALSMLLPIGVAHAAETPTGMLEAYAAEAKRADAGFRGFDATAGKGLYLQEEVRGGQRTSCATCHTADPIKVGRSPVGKRIDPLAPSANPQRFTDRDETAKWFERNCKQVLGRSCTAKEKGDVLTWLLTL